MKLVAEQTICSHLKRNNTEREMGFWKKESGIFLGEACGTAKLHFLYCYILFQPLALLTMILI